MALDHKNSILRSSTGTTLIETMFVVGGFMLVVTCMLCVFQLGVKHYSKDTERYQSSGSALMAMEYLKRDLRNASQVVSYSSAGSISTLQVSAPSYNNSGVMKGLTDTITYTVNTQNSLTRTVIAAPGSLRKTETNRVLARNVSGFAASFNMHEFFTGDGSTRTFALLTSWLSTPQCIYNGSPVVTGFTYDSTRGTATFTNAPSSGTPIEFAYTVSPNDPDGVEAASEIVVSLTTMASGGGSATSYSTSARLRNKQ